MRGALPKFTAPLLGDAEFVHADLYSREVHPTWERLTIGCREREIDRMLDLCRGMNGPFGVLYVLLVSRVGHLPSRYQGPRRLDHGELESFLRPYQDYFEQDGRHHLWIASTTGEGTLVFDNHNVVYAYGDLDRYERELRAAGFGPGATPTPAPHTHHYHAAFDEAERQVMNHWAWLRSDLHPDDDP